MARIIDPVTYYPPVPTALVVGASTGIGLALARRLVGRDWTVIGIARRPSELTHDRYRHVIADVSAADFGTTLSGALGTEVPDVCLYTAGIGKELDLDDLSIEADVFRTNLVGAVVTAEVVIPRMLRAKAGHVVGLSSQADQMTDGSAPSYAASKAGLTSYLEGLARACRPHGVAVTNIRFGFVDTAMATASIRPFMISADRAAALVDRCLERRPIRYTYPWRMAALLWLLRFVRRLMFWKP
jgi:NAD(P)-dependent dehydrogenase (short-subunit alcohol dehydrogenase family)